MLSAFATILAIVAPVFACAGLGFVWARTGRPYDRALITALISNIGAPCLVFRNLVGLAVDPAAMLEIALAAGVSILVFTVLGYVFLRAVRLPSHTFLPPLVFANAGNMGLAICNFAFPGESGQVGLGLALGVCYFAVASLLHFTLGVVLWSGRLAPAELARTPLTWAAGVAALVVATGLSVPGWILDTTGLLGDLCIPLMLLTLGVALAELRVDRLPRSILLSAVRLGMGALVGFGVAAAFDLEGAARGVVILECAMPAAVFNALFAEKYQRSPDQVASLVVVSTLLSFLSLPFVLAAVL